MKKNNFYQPQFNCDDVEILETQPCYRGFVQVNNLHIKHRLFDNKQFNLPVQRESVTRRAAAAVFLHDPIQQTFLMVEQFRVGALNDPISPWHLEVIAGLIDVGEDAKQCLIRETKEEAGCHLEKLQPVFDFYTSTGASNEVVSLYVATADLTQAGGIFGEADEGEDILVHIFDYEDIPHLIADGHIRNAIALVALQWFRLNSSSL